MVRCCKRTRTATELECPRRKLARRSDTEDGDEHAMNIKSDNNDAMVLVNMVLMARVRRRTTRTARVIGTGQAPTYSYHTIEVLHMLTITTASGHLYAVTLSKILSSGSVVFPCYHRPITRPKP